MLRVGRAPAIPKSPACVPQRSLRRRALQMFRREPAILRRNSVSRGAFIELRARLNMCAHKFYTSMNFIAVAGDGRVRFVESITRGRFRRSWGSLSWCDPWAIRTHSYRRPSGRRAARFSFLRSCSGAACEFQGNTGRCNRPWRRAGQQLDDFTATADSACRPHLLVRTPKHEPREPSSISCGR